MEDQLWNQFITSEQDLLSKKVLQLEVALDIQSQRLVKKILRPVDEADAYFDKANIDKAQLIDKLAAILDEYTKIEQMLKWIGGYLKFIPMYQQTSENIGIALE